MRHTPFTSGRETELGCTSLQDMQVREEHFQHKQRVLQEVIAKANARVAQRKRAALSTCLSAWRHVSGVYKILAQRLAALQRLSLAGAMQHWRRYTFHKVCHQVDCLVYLIGIWWSQGLY